MSTDLILTDLATHISQLYNSIGRQFPYVDVSTDFDKIVLISYLRNYAMSIVKMFWIINN